ncbi:MAG TPA: alpha/beta hydrolase [Solirubrobacteraceae bacterium]|nr:alpha/beta hydrolase [Solirubrobacteraceae bacterium]
MATCALTDCQAVKAERGTMGALPFAAVGSGRPLVLLAGLSPTTGIEGEGVPRTMLGPLAELAQSRRVVVFNRRPRLPRGMTMADFASEHAAGVREGLGTAVDVVGVSTGGSIAQQLAADHPDVVARLALVSTACRLGADGRALQRRVAARIRGGARRQAFAVMAAGLVPPRRGQIAAACAAWLIGPLVIRDAQGLDDMAMTIEAEDAFDLAALSPIKARTLIVAGADDRFYDRELFEETARLIPGSELHVVPGRGHVTVMGDRAARSALASFLS